MQVEVVHFAVELKRAIAKIAHKNRYEITVLSGSNETEQIRIQPVETIADVKTEECHVLGFIGILQQLLPKQMLERVELTAVSDGRSAVVDPTEENFAPDLTHTSTSSSSTNGDRLAHDPTLGSFYID